MNIRYLILPLTTRCNLACAYCYTGGTTEPAEMTEGLLEAALKQVDTGRGRFHLQITGGEPTLVPERVEAAVRGWPVFSTEPCGIRARMRKFKAVSRPSFLRRMPATGDPQFKRLENAVKVEWIEWHSCAKGGIDGLSPEMVQFPLEDRHFFGFEMGLQMVYCLIKRYNIYRRRGIMIIAKTTEKGHVIIPAALRKKFNIKKGSRLAVYEGEGNVILIRPLPEDPVEASRGMLKGKTSLLKALLRDRSEERKRG